MLKPTSANSGVTNISCFQSYIAIGKGKAPEENSNCLAILQ